MKKIGIIVAMDMELELLKNTMEISSKNTVGGSIYYEGNLGGHSIVLVCCGVGKVNAAVCATIMCNHFGVSCMINSGVAGGIAGYLIPFDIVISTEYVAHDVTPRISETYFPNIWVYPSDSHLSDLAFVTCKKLGLDRVFLGRIATGDIYVESSRDKGIIKEKTSPLCVEMEGQSIAQVCHIFAVPFVAVRSISDSSDGNSNMDFNMFAEKASIIASKIVIQVITDMPSDQ